MDLATIEPGLLAWLSTLTGTALALCVKANAARPVVQVALGVDGAGALDLLAARLTA